MKKHHGGPQIVGKPREADVALGQSRTVAEVCKKLQVSEQTCYRWAGGRSMEG